MMMLLFRVFDADDKVSAEREGASLHLDETFTDTNCMADSHPKIIRLVTCVVLMTLELEPFHSICFG